MPSFSKQDQTSRGPRRSSRIKATRTQWAELHALKQGPCRVCGAPPPNQLHHTVKRSQGSGDVPDCLVPLCAVCHDAVEKHDPTACQKVAASLTGQERAYILSLKGRGWLETMYHVNEMGRPDPVVGEYRMVCYPCRGLPGLLHLGDSHGECGICGRETIVSFCQWRG